MMVWINVILVLLLLVVQADCSCSKFVSFIMQCQDLLKNR